MPAVDLVAQYETALQQIYNVMGPQAAPCCQGCNYEWNEALRLVREALGDKLKMYKSDQHYHEVAGPDLSDEAPTVIFAGTPPPLDGREPDFTVTGTELICDAHVCVNWQTNSAGFGQLYLRPDLKGRALLSTETMDKDFVKAVLCKLVDDGVIED